MELISPAIFRIQNKTFHSNTYLVFDQLTSKCVIIDPGFDYDLLIKNLLYNKFNPLAIIATHGHFDHVAGVNAIQKTFNIPFYIHERELGNLKKNNFLLKISKMKLSIDNPVPDYTFTNEFELIKIQDFCFSIYNYPGHTEGSCIIQYSNHLFTGDTLYKNRLGVENNFGEDIKKLKISLSKIYNNFDNNHIVFPGHGSYDYLINIMQNNREVNDFLLSF